jgi:PTH1 family peptidyl-tRNA hydrolase
MARTKRLIVGLGNPGEEYAGTRHNAGFMLVDALADRLRVEVDDYHAEALNAEAGHRGYPLVLAKPTTYVNRSGDAARRLLNKHGLEPRDLLVVVDDLNLDVGALRLRPGGGSGGHNGLASIAQALGTTDYPRLRLGIGSDYERGGQVDYVLAPFSAEQRPRLREALEAGREAALCFVTDGIEEAMNRFN